jgi:hypothetical protein
LTTEIGCAAVGGRGGEGRFPTRQELAKIAAAPAPAKLARGGAVDAEEWQLTGPLPDAIDGAIYSDGSPWQVLLEQAIAPRAGLVALPASMQCVARETGLFYLAKQGLPSDRLARFIQARCGVVASDVAFYYVSGSVPEETSAERIVENYRAQFLEQTKAALKGGTQLAGVWFGQDKGRAVLMLTVASRHATLEKLPLVPTPDGTVVIRGEVLQPADRIEALFNRGRFGYGTCDVDSNVRLPRFAVTCKVDPGDAVTSLEIAAFPAGRIIGPIVANFMLWPSGTPASSYHGSSYVNHSVQAGPDSREQLLSLVNEVRRAAGLAEVTLAPRESTVAERVAPHYFAALVGAEEPLVADQVVLGLRAGWEVEGAVRIGHFTAGAVEKTNDLGRLVDELLERPMGREALLTGSAQKVAIGPVIAPEQQVIGVVASSYELFESANHESDVQSVLERLSKSRQAHSMKPPTILAGVRAEAQEAAARVQQGDSSPRQALDRMLNRSAEKYPGFAFNGWVFEASSLDDLTFPPELLRQPLGGVAVAVAHYRPKNSPWSQLVVLIIAASAGSGEQMSVGREVFTM